MHFITVCKLKKWKTRPRRQKWYQYSDKSYCITYTILRLRPTLAIISRLQHCFIYILYKSYLYQESEQEQQELNYGLQPDYQCAEVNFSQLPLSGVDTLKNEQHRIFKSCWTARWSRLTPSKIHQRMLLFLRMQDDITLAD